MATERHRRERHHNLPPRPARYTLFAGSVVSFWYFSVFGDAKPRGQARSASGDSGNKSRICSDYSGFYYPASTLHPFDALHDNQMDTIIAAVTGLVAGAIGSLVAPWVQWAIETRRSKLSYRRELIARWREAIERHNHEESDFTDTAAYSAIRSHMDQELARSLERGTVCSTRRGGHGNGRKYVLMDEIARIERDWDLV